MEPTRDWPQLSWEEKREIRFQRWLNPPGVEFESPEAAELYRARVNRLIKAIKLPTPVDRPANKVKLKANK